MSRPPEVPWFERDDDEPEHTYFGLEVIRETLVRESDIAVLPFYNFWNDSSRGSTVVVNSKTDENLVPLSDWRAFSLLFIETGQRRFMLGNVQTANPEKEP